MGKRINKIFSFGPPGISVLDRFAISITVKTAASKHKMAVAVLLKRIFYIFSHSSSLA